MRSLSEVSSLGLPLAASIRSRLWGSARVKPLGWGGSCQNRREHPREAASGCRGALPRPWLRKRNVAAFPSVPPRLLPQTKAVCGYRAPLESLSSREVGGKGQPAASGEGKPAANVCPAEGLGATRRLHGFGSCPGPFLCPARLRPSERRESGGTAQRQQQPGGLWDGKQQTEGVWDSLVALCSPWRAAF